MKRIVRCRYNKLFFVLLLALLLSACGREMSNEGQGAETSDQTEAADTAAATETEAFDTNAAAPETEAKPAASSDDGKSAGSIRLPAAWAEIADSCTFTMAWAYGDWIYESACQEASVPAESVMTALTAGEVPLPVLCLKSENEMAAFGKKYAADGPGTNFPGLQEVLDGFRENDFEKTFLFAIGFEMQEGIYRPEEFSVRAASRDGQLHFTVSFQESMCWAREEAPYTHWIIIPLERSMTKDVTACDAVIKGAES